MSLLVSKPGMSKIFNIEIFAKISSSYLYYAHSQPSILVLIKRGHIRYSVEKMSMIFQTRITCWKLTTETCFPPPEKLGKVDMSGFVSRRLYLCLDFYLLYLSGLLPPRIACHQSRDHLVRLTSPKPS